MRRVLGGLASLSFGVLILIGGALYMRLAAGPIRLDALSPRLEAAIGERLDGFSLQFDGVVIALGMGEPPLPGLFLHRLDLRDADGQSVAAAATARLGFDPLALLAGRLALRTIDLSGAEIIVERDALGRVQGEIAPGDPAGAAADLFAAFDRDAPPLIAGLERLAFHDTTLRIAAKALGEPHTVTGAHLVISRRHGSLRARAHLPGAALGAAVQVEAVRETDGRLRGEANFAGFDLATMAGWDRALAPLARHTATVEGMLALALDRDGAVRALEIRADLGQGWIDLGSGRVALNGASVAARVDPVSGQVHLDRVAVDTALGGLAVSGSMHREHAGDAAARLVTQLDIAALRIASHEAGLPAVRFEAGGAQVRLDPGAGRLDIADLWLSGDDLRIGARGSVVDDGNGPVLVLDIDGKGLTAPQLKALWPPTLAPKTRLWLEENLTGGRITEAAAALRGPADSPALGLSFAFADGEAVALRGLPPIAGAAGWAEFDGTSFAMTLGEGHVAVPGGGQLDLAGSSLTIPDVADIAAPARIAIAAAGPIGAALRLIDMPPLGLLTRGGIDPGIAEGEARIMADLALPLKRELPVEALTVSVSATLAGVVARPTALGGPVEISTMSLTADTRQLAARGRARFAGVDGSFTFDETFAPAEDGLRGRLTVQAALSAADATRLGLPPGGDWLSVDGRVPVDLTVERRSPAESRFAAVLDLGPATVSIKPLAWRKTAGDAASARIEGVVSGAETRLERISADAPGLRLRGAARLAAGGRLESLDLTAFELAGRADLSARLRREAEGLALAIAGTRLSLEGLDLAARHGVADDIGPMTLSVDLEALDLAGGVRLAPARGQIGRDAAGAVRVDLNGAVGAGATFEATLDLDGGGRGRLRVNSGDAGAVLRGAGLFRRGVGGGLTLDAILGDGPMRGEAVITDFVVGSHPSIERALADADLDAALQRLRGEGLHFDRVRAPFRWQGDRVSFDEAVAYGAVIGLSLSGDYMIAEDRLAMQGVFTPLYGLNSLIGAVPLLGPLLTGGAGQGVIAFTFDVGGPVADPLVQVNPFSALLPGVLRQIIQSRPGPG